MYTSMKHQAGGSPVMTLIILVLAAYGVYVGVQYAPQFIEAKSIQSILDDAREMQASDPVDSAQSATARVVKLLQINDLNDMTDQFSVARRNGRFVVTFSYDRELNLLYEKRTIHYGQTVTL